MSEHILDTDFSVEWVAKVICESQGIDCLVTSHKEKRIGVGEGFLSHIIRLELEWDDKSDKLPKSVVLKVPTLATIQPHIDKNTFNKKGEVADQEKVNQYLRMTHMNEVQAYELFKTFSPVPMPKCYYGSPINQDNKGGILMIEDFSEVANTVNIADGLNLNQVYTVAEALASLHAWSLSHSGWDGKFRVLGQERIARITNNMPVILEKLQKMKAEWFTGFSEKLEWCFDADFMQKHVCLSHEDMNLPPVLVQGDMWTNNLLFENGGDKLLAIVDWQMAHTGGFMEDIGRILVTCCQGDMRRRETSNVLKHYHNKLTTLWVTNAHTHWATLKKGTNVCFHFQPCSTSSECQS